MPVYEYQCKDCGHRFEVRQKFSDPPVSECTQCGGHAKKAISVAGFALKGGGWYQQGYNTSGAKEESCPAATSVPSESCAGCPKAVNG